MSFQFVTLLLRDECVLDTVDVNTQNTLAAMRKLESNLSSGPDGLPPLLFKRLRYCLAEPLALLFSLCQLCHPIGKEV